MHCAAYSHSDAMQIFLLHIAFVLARIIRVYVRTLTYLERNTTDCIVHSMRRVYLHRNHRSMNRLPVGWSYFPLLFIMQINFLTLHIFSLEKVFHLSVVHFPHQISSYLHFNWETWTISSFAYFIAFKWKISASLIDNLYTKPNLFKRLLHSYWSSIADRHLLNPWWFLFMCLLLSFLHSLCTKD